MKPDVTAKHSPTSSESCTHDEERVKMLNPQVPTRYNKGLSVVTVAITSL